MSAITSRAWWSNSIRMPKGFTRGRKGGASPSDEQRPVAAKAGRLASARLPVERSAKRFDVFRTARSPSPKATASASRKTARPKSRGRPKARASITAISSPSRALPKRAISDLEKGKLLPKDWGHSSLGYVDTSAMPPRQNGGPGIHRGGQRIAPGCESAAMVCVRFPWPGNGEKSMSIISRTCAMRLRAPGNDYRRSN